MFSRDVTVAILVFLNNGTAAMWVYPTNPPGIELYYHANVFFCFGGKTRSIAQTSYVDGFHLTSQQLCWCIEQ